MRYIFDVDQMGNGTVTIGDNIAPIRVVGLSANFSPDVVVAFDDRAAIADRKGSPTGEFSLSGTLDFRPVNNQTK